MKEHSEEFLNVKTLDHHSPPWTRSTLFNDNLIKWAKAKVYIYTYSVLCVSKMEQNPGAADAKWTGQIEDLKRYPSYQDAVGLDGEAIEFEWNIFRGSTTLTIVKEIQMDLERKNIEPEDFKDRIYLCLCLTIASGKRMMRLACRTPRKSRITQTCFYQDIGLFWVQVLKRDGTVVHMMDNGTVQPTKWYSNSKKVVILYSQPPVL